MMSIAHSEQDIDRSIEAFDATLAQMRSEALL
jgi:hypothetical protein